MTPHPSRRAFLVATGLTGAAAVLPACGSVARQHSPGRARSDLATWTDTSSGVSSATPRRGGTLTVGIESEQNGWNPPAAQWDQSGDLVAQALYDPLVVVGADGTLLPYLAKEIRPNRQYTEWTIVVRPGVRFHDGTPLDGAALAINLQAFVDAPLTAAALTTVADIWQTGADRVVVRMKSPWVPFAAYFTNLIGWMAAPKYLRSGKLDTAVGTGPFMFKEWVPNDHLTVVRNPNYWRSDLPHLDAVVFKVIPDAQARNNALLSGAVDLIQSSDALTLQTFRNKSGFTIITDGMVSAVEPDVEMFLLNCAKKPLDDLRLRRAMAHAIDRNEINSVLLGGFGAPADGPFPAGSPYHAATNYPAFDLAKARSLVDDVKRETGPVAITLKVTNSASHRRRGELVQQMLTAAGINAKLSILPTADHIAAVLVGDFDAAAWRSYSASEPDLNYLWWSETTNAPLGKLALNLSRLADRDLEKGLTAGRTSRDHATRVAAYQTVARRLGELVPQLWMDRAVWSFVASSAVQNFNFATEPGGRRMLPMTAGKQFLTQTWLS
jgi:peptide/nickel transport system substrate-binding protein